MPRYRFKPRPLPPGYRDAWGVVESDRLPEVGGPFPRIHPGEWVIAERIDVRDDYADIDGDIYVELRRTSAEVAEKLGNSA